MELFQTGIRPEDVGKHMLFEHYPFCDEWCIDAYKKKGRKAEPADRYLEWWKKERKARKKKS